MSIFKNHEIRELYKAALSANLVQSRQALLMGIDGNFVGQIPDQPNATAQILTDLTTMNEAGALTSGAFPLRTWLANAVLLARPRNEEVIFSSYLYRIPGISEGYIAPAPFPTERAPFRTAPVAKSTRRRGEDVGGASAQAYSERPGGYPTFEGVTSRVSVSRESTAQPGALAPVGLRRGASAKRSWGPWARMAALVSMALLGGGFLIHQIPSSKSVFDVPSKVQPPSGERPAAPSPEPPSSPITDVQDFSVLIWGAGYAPCASSTPEVLIGDCAHRHGLEWLTQELWGLRAKGVECLSGLPSMFVLRSDDDLGTGKKDKYLNIYEPGTGKRIGNVWFKQEGLTITDFTKRTRSQVVLLYQQRGTWWVLRQGQPVLVP